MLAIGRNFADALIDKINEKQTPCCVGLDPRIADIPAEIRDDAVAKHGNSVAAVAESFAEFNRRIIDSVQHIVGIVKPQIAFYECYGSEGMKAFAETVSHAKKRGMIVIADVKRNDIGPAAQAYADGFLGSVSLCDGSRAAGFDADAVTVVPYTGSDGIGPFVAACRNGKGIFIFCKSSNPSSAELQDRLVDGAPLYETVASLISGWGEGTEGSSGYRSVGAVVAATYPEHAAKVRKMLKNSFFLVPGFGAQGASAADAAACFNSDGFGAVVNSSREIIFAHKKSSASFDDAAAAAAEKMKQEIAAAMKERGAYPW